MQKWIVLIIMTLTLTALTAACATILEGDRLSESVYVVPPYIPDEEPPEERIEVADIDEIKTVMLDLIMNHESVGKLVINNNTDEDGVQSGIDKAAKEIITLHPIGAYAVSSIMGTTSKVLLNCEIDISIEYKRTIEQLDSIINVSNMRYLRTELLSIMSEYREEAVFRSTLDITEEDIREYAREIYYENPRYIVMLPVIAFEAFPPDGEDRIIELRFVHIEQTSIMRQYSDSLTAHVRGNAGLAVGRNDGETLLSLVENLISSVRFDVAAAWSISEHGAQNFSATAFGALVRQNAVGEGGAMAFKALCDELGFDCRVVLGYLDGRTHAWNIVSLAGWFYHIDVSMSARNGIETAFLKTDEGFIEEFYEWDFENTITCNGALTYEDIVFTDDEEEDDDMDENGEETDGETNEEIIVDEGDEEDNEVIDDTEGEED